MLETMNPQKFKAGTLFFMEGDPPGNIYLIHQGEVNIVKFTGGEEKLLKTLGWNDIFGEMALVDNSPRSATARAKTDVWAYEISKDMFAEHLKSMDPFMQGIFKSLSKLVRELTAKQVGSGQLKSVKPESEF